MERLSEGDTSRTQAAIELGIGYATLKRLLDDRHPKDQRPPKTKKEIPN